MPLIQTRGWGSGPRRRPMTLLEFRDELHRRFKAARDGKNGKRVVNSNELLKIMREVLADGAPE